MGQGFDSASVVKFGGVKATSITLTGTTYIVATVPTRAVDGKVTVTTGSTTLTSTQTFIVHGSWSKGAVMLTHVRYPAGVGAINGKIYVVGGITTGSTIIATSQAYNTATNKWTTAAPLPTAATDGTGAVVNGILYVIGGYNGTNTLNTVYAYNPSTNTWTSKASMPTAYGSGKWPDLCNWWRHRHNSAEYGRELQSGYRPSGPRKRRCWWASRSPLWDWWTQRSSQRMATQAPATPVTTKATTPQPILGSRLPPTPLLATIAVMA
jgi:hypothetical protein